MHSLVGTTLGEYRLNEVLWQDDLSFTFRAFHENSRRHVSLTVIRPPYLDDPALRREFEREAPLLRKLAHPFIPPIYQAQFVKSTPLIAARIPPATQLGSLMNRPLKLEKVVTIAVQVGNALEQAQRLGLTHAGINPANVRLGENERVAVIGFGVAALAAASTRLLKDRVTGQWPEYLAPEQARGYGANARSDVFTLGVLMYRLYFGVAPFPGATAAEVAGQHNHFPPSPRSLDPTVTAEMEQVFRRALAKNAQFRFPSAGVLIREFMTAAEGILDGPPPRITSPLSLPGQTPLPPPLRDLVPRIATPVPASSSPPTPVPTLERPQMVYTAPILERAQADASSGFRMGLWVGLSVGVAFALGVLVAVVMFVFASAGASLAGR